MTRQNITTLLIPHLDKEVTLYINVYKRQSSLQVTYSSCCYSNEIFIIDFLLVQMLLIENAQLNLPINAHSNNVEDQVPCLL